MSGQSIVDRLNATKHTVASSALDRAVVKATTEEIPKRKHLDYSSEINVSIPQMAPPIGGIVKCTTCLGNSVQGKVVAYDQQTRMLALRSTNPNKSGLYDISFLNIDWCSDLDIIEEPNEPPEVLPNLNIQKLSRRTRENIDNKIKEINSLGNNVSSLAQHLYFTISKTISEVEWNDKKIIVMNSVIIEPPYDTNSCFSKRGENTQALEHVKKIVKKFHEDYTKLQQDKSQQNSTQLDSPTILSSPTNDK